MKKLTILSLLTSLFCLLIGQEYRSDLSSIKGIKSEIRQEYNFQETFGEWKEIPGKEKIQYKYDKEGYLVDESTYTLEGKLKVKTTYKYNSNGDRIEKNDYQSNGSLQWNVKYKYDATGNMIEESKYDSDGWKLYTKKNYIFLKYNSMGKVVEETKYDSDRLLKSKITFKYDNFGNLLETSKFGLMKSKLTSRYDVSGNITEEIKYDSEGTLTSQSVSKFDSIGNHIAWSMYDPEGNLAPLSSDDLYLKDYSKWVRNYDTDGKPTEASFYDSSEKLKQKFVYSYSDKRNYEYVVYFYEYKFGEMQEIPVKKFTFEYEEY